MRTPPPLSVRNEQVKVKVINGVLRFEEFVNRFDELRDINNIDLYVDNLDMLKSNINLVNELVKNGCSMVISSLDYEILEYIENNILPDNKIELRLMDDYENKDRSYIYPSNFKNTEFSIPFTYVQWCNNVENDILVTTSTCKDQLLAAPNAAFRVLPIEFLKYLRELTYNLSKNIDDLNDVDKSLVITNYLQNICQFVENINTEASDGIYHIETDITNFGTTVYSPITVLQKHYGLCAGISRAEVLLLNNPLFNVNVRQVSSSDHVYNVINIDGKNYYNDTTWNITRNPNRYPESLKAKEISVDYSFFGKDKALNIGHHEDYTYAPNIEKEDLSRDIINEGLYKIKHITKLSDYDKPVFKSKILK